MRSVRPEGAAGSRLRVFIEEFPSPAGGTNRYTQSEDRRATVGCASYLRFCDLRRHMDTISAQWPRTAPGARLAAMETVLRSASFTRLCSVSSPVVYSPRNQLRNLRPGLDRPAVKGTRNWVGLLGTHLGALDKERGEPMSSKSRRTTRTRYEIAGRINAIARSKACPTPVFEIVFRRRHTLNR